jgi:hypothetical protein
MDDIKNAIAENVAFYRDQERKIAARLAQLPKGRIRDRKIGGESYHYLEYRKGRSVRTDYVGKSVPRSLQEGLAERARLEKELRGVREAQSLYKSGRKEEIDLTGPVMDVLRVMTKHGLWDEGFEIIGSWCFLLYQKHLPMEKYPVRTEDLDILVPRPFKGRPVDIGELLQRLGFRQHFNPDGSVYFAGNRMKVEFVTRERRDGTLPPRYMKEISLTPQELRHLEILAAGPVILKLGPGIRARIPGPAAFFLHKLFLAARPERGAKKEKDIKQAVYVGRYILSEAPETDRLLGLWADLSRRWKSLIRRSLAGATDLMPLETTVIERLLGLLL